MSKILVGFSRVNINPMRGIGVAGYYKVRRAEGILDDLEAVALALSDGGKKAVVISMDLCQVQTPICDRLRRAVAEATGLDASAVYLHSTHTHTAPYVDVERAKAGGLDTEEDLRLVAEYQDFLCHRIVDVTKAALEDLAPARIGTGVSVARNVAFIRRFRMKDGSVRTNPGVNNPDIVAPIGEIDDRVSVVRFDREGAPTIVLASFANHPDVVGGNLLSGDWPAMTRRTVEKALDNTRCIFLNGAQGDINHVNVRPTGGFGNDLTRDFDDVDRGYGHARYMARVVAGAVMQIFDKVEYREADTVRFAQKLIELPSNRPAPEEMAEAHRINDIHTSGHDELLPYEGMMLTTVVADAARKVRLENGPDAFTLRLSAVAIGDVAFIGVPGEPFNGIGRALKLAEGYGMVIPSCLVNGSEGYFPMRDAYEEGGYEARSSNYKVGGAERLIDEGLSLLAELK
ncbi:MAG: hypothetical protein IKC73_02635 [Clostridia bacterium]|nr:hypothetical protein [Clostridia bacterium]